MIILGVYNGHDAGAALFDDYRMVSAVALERVTRLKGDGGRFPHEAVDECLAAAGIGRRDVEVVAMSLGDYPGRYLRDGHGSGREQMSLVRELVRT